MKQKSALFFLLLSISIALTAHTEGASLPIQIEVKFPSCSKVPERMSFFKLLAFNEADPCDLEGIPLLQILDRDGKAVASGSWHGNRPGVSKDGLEWRAGLTAQIGTTRLNYELKSIWTNKTKLKAGKAELSLSILGDGQGNVQYSHVLRFPGVRAWASEDGMSAVVGQDLLFRDGLSRFAVLSVKESTCSFKAEQIVEIDENNKHLSMPFIEAMSETQGAEVGTSRLIMGISITIVETWSFEPALALASAMGLKSTEPDVRIFGSANKREAVLGEEIEYSYFLFNAGMDEAADIKVTIPLSDGTSLVPGSINGSSGKAILAPSYKLIEVSSERKPDTSQDPSIRSFQWMPGCNLMPGETIEVSFSVVFQL